MYAKTDANITISYNLKNPELVKLMHDIPTFKGIKDYAITSYNYLYLKNKEAKYTDEYKEIFADSYFESDTYETLDENGNKIILDNQTAILVYRIGTKAYNDYLKKLNLNYDDIKEKGILINNAIVLTNDGSSDNQIKKSINIFNYKKNDVIKLSDEGKEYNITVGLVTNERPFGLQYYFSTTPIIILSDEYFNKIIDDDKAYEYILIDAENPNELQDEIEKYIPDDYEYSIYNLNEEVEQMNSIFTLVAIFLYGFIIVIALIGITNIFNTITTNMELRSREFAMLKSIGMTKKEFNKMIRLESLFYGLKSLLIGIPIGLLLSVLIYKGLAETSGISYKLPLTAIIISILAVFILILLIMKFTIRKINKQNTIETIRNENI